MHTELVLDRALTPELRTRGWRLRGDHVPDWPAAAHPGFEIAWPEAGGIRYEIHGRRFEIEVGQAMVVTPQIEHRTRVRPDTKATSLWIGRELVAEVAELIGPHGRFEPRVVPDASPLAALGNLLVREALTDGPGAYLTAGALAEALAVQLLRALDGGAAPTSGDPRVDAAIDRIESSYAEPLTVDDLARAAGMSRYHFSRAFRARTETSPYQYLLRTRVRRAAELLRGGRRSVTEAAFEVGFADLGRFGRAFQRELGVTPSRYRAAHASIAVRRDSSFAEAG